MKRLKHYCAFLVLGFVLVQCKKEETPMPCTAETPPADLNSTFVLELDHLWLGNSFDLVDTLISTDTDTVHFGTCKYYISNIKLLKDGEATWEQTDSYHLINLKHGSTPSFTIDAVRDDTYNGIQLSIGVDSTHNVSGAQSGALDPLNGMFWSWNTGYIFFKAEGTFANGEDEMFIYHIGGYKSPHAAYRTLNYIFDQPLTLSADESGTVTLSVEMSKLFKGPTELDPLSTPFMMSTGEEASRIADNVASMFELKSVVD